MNRPSVARAPRMPPSPLRRALVALAIALSGAGGSIGLLGLAAAQGPPTLAYSFAAVHVGDEGAYVPEGLEPPLSESSQDRFLGYTFSLGAPQPLALPDGQRRLVVPWREVQHARDPSGRNSSWTFAVDLDAASGEPLAHSAQQWGSMGGLVNAPGILESTVRERPVLTVYGEAWALCGYRMEAPLPPQSGPIHVSGRCLPDAKTGSWQPANFTVVGIEPLAGGHALHLRAQQGNNRTDLWMDAGIPYPIRIQQQSDASGTDKSWTLVLASFRAGTTLLPTSSVLDGIQPVAITWAPRQVFGPSEDGVEVAFPLSQAWRSAATRDPDVAQFLSRHPDAAVAAAQFREKAKEDQEERTWTFIVAAPNSMQALEVQVTRRELAGLTQTVGGLAHGASDVTVSEGVTLAPDQTRFLGLATLPTVHSMFARWAQHVSPEEAAAGPNSWAFSLLCPGKVALHCPLQGPWFSAGRWQFEAGFLPESVETNDTGTELGFDAQGKVSFVQRWKERTTADVGPAATPRPVSPTPPMSQSRPAPSFAWPSAMATAAAGGASLVVALFYWLWPTLKGAGWGLFSRVREEALLAHPVRKQLAALVSSQPGIHLLGLVRATGRSAGSVRHHLQLLLDRGVVVRHRGPHYDLYFMAGIPRIQVASARALKSPSARRVLDAIARGPGRNGLSIALETGLDPSTVSECARALHAAGLVEIRRAGRNRRLYAAPAAQDVLTATGLDGPDEASVATRT